MKNNALSEEAFIIQDSRERLFWEADYVFHGYQGHLHVIEPDHTSVDA